MTAVDPISVSVLQRRLKTITEEMGLALLRTTRSPILREGRDCAMGLYDPAGWMLEQTEYTALLGFALQPSLQYVIDYYRDEIEPGDVIFHNDVYAEGNQIADVGVYKPIFWHDNLVGWSACKGHQADLGGGAPGGYNPMAREIWHEGLRIPPIKVYENGRFRRDVWDLIFANVRLDIVAEDLRAAIGACAVGERRVLEILDRYGLEWFEAHTASLVDSTERAMRREIEKIPDGVYTGESWLVYDGVQPDKRHRFFLTVTVAGDEIMFDFTGTDPASPGYANSPLHASTSGLLLAFLMHVDPDMPHNAGMLRPIKMHFPEGSLLNAKFPAATSYGNHLTHQIAAAVQLALAKAIPERVTAGWGTFEGVVPSGIDPRRNRRYVDFCLFACKGGSGGTFGADGYDHIGTIMTGGALGAQDPEMHELQDPHFVEEYEYLPDSAGPGQWRGGLGVRTRFRMYGINTSAVTFGQGMDESERPFGLFGGKPAGLNRVIYHYPDGRTYAPRAHDLVYGLDGVVVEQEAAGGGGYGDPHLRPAEVVRDEVGDGIVSLESARRDYGVAIDPDSLEIDWSETERLRRRAKS